MCLVPALCGFAAPNQSVEAANKAYSEDDFAKAIELYNKAMAEDGKSSDLYYNIGNSHYRLGEVGEAVLNYERALKLNPSNKDARTNLQFVNEKHNLTTDTGKGYFSSTFYNWICSYSSNFWAYFAGVSFILFIAALLGYLFLDNIALRKIGFFGGGILLVVWITSLAFAYITYCNAVESNYAIITVPSATLSTSPREPKDKSEEAFLLKEGFKVEILDSVKVEDNTWLDVCTDEQNRAWILEKQVTKI